MPELDALFDQLIGSLHGEGDEANYFEDGRVIRRCESSLLNLV